MPLPKDMQDAEIYQRLSELWSAQANATSWGAAVGARDEEIKDLNRELRRRNLEVVETKNTPTQSPPETSSALDRQVGGTHYKRLAIQSVEFIERNHLGFLEGC